MYRSNSDDDNHHSVIPTWRMTTGASKQLEVDILNDDVCHAIAIAIVLDHGIQALLEFSLTCKRFRHTALQTIFKTIRIPAPGGLAQWDRKLQRFEAFSRHSHEAVRCARNLLLVGPNFPSWTFDSSSPILVFPRRLWTQLRGSQWSGITSMTLAPHTSLDHIDFGIPANGLPLFAQLRDLTIPLHHISICRILQFASNLSMLSLTSIRMDVLREVLSIKEYPQDGMDSFKNLGLAEERRFGTVCTSAPTHIPPITSLRVMRVHGWSAANPSIELVDILALAARIAPMVEKLEGFDGATPGCIRGLALEPGTNDNSRLVEILKGLQTLRIMELVYLPQSGDRMVSCYGVWGVTDSNSVAEPARDTLISQQHPSEASYASYGDRLVNSGQESEEGRPRPIPEVIRQILDGVVCFVAEVCPSIQVLRHIYDDKVHPDWTRRPQAFTFEAKIEGRSAETIWALRVNDLAKSKG